MKKYRSSNESWREILKLLNDTGGNGLNKTQIKSQASLTSRQMRVYIPELIRDDFIQFDEKTRNYKVTEHGLKFLDFDIGKIFEQAMNIVREKGLSRFPDNVYSLEYQHDNGNYDFKEYRDKTRITQTMLEAAVNGINKTQMKFRASLSSRQVTTYLSKKIRSGFIEFDETTRLYKTTSKGLKLLEGFRKIDMEE